MDEPQWTRTWRWPKTTWTWAVFRGRRIEKIRRVRSGSGQSRPAAVGPATNIKSLQHARRDCKSHVARIPYTRRSRIPWGWVVVGSMVRVSMPAVSRVSNSVRAPSPSQSLPGVQSDLNHGNQHESQSGGGVYGLPAAPPDGDPSPGPSPTRGGVQCPTCRLASRASDGRSGIMRRRSRSFVSLTPACAGHGRQGFLRMTVCAETWPTGFADGYCRAYHSERSRRISRLFDCPQDRNAVNTFARRHRRHRSGQTRMSAPPSHTLPHSAGAHKGRLYTGNGT